MNAQQPVTIRRAVPQDAALLAEVGARTFTETFAADNDPQDMAAYVASAFNDEQQRAELAEPDSIFLIAEAEARAAGYAKLHAGPAERGVDGAKPIEIVRLYVSREWLGRKVGEALMRACLEIAKDAGHDVIWLGVWERNARAQAFYRKWDFREVGAHVFQLGSDAQRDILMARPLSSAS